MDLRPLLALTLACGTSMKDDEVPVPPGGKTDDPGGDAMCAEGAVGGERPDFDGPRVVVRGAEMPFAVSPVQLGANINKWFDDAQGLWDPALGQPVVDAVAKARRAGLGLLRHPGGTSANLFDWKRAVGPVSARRCQTDGDFSSRPDTSYGPSEFMELVRAVGAEGQIMLPFHRSGPRAMSRARSRSTPAAASHGRRSRSAPPPGRTAPCGSRSSTGA